jgi:hypothetical protein
MTELLYDKKALPGDICFRGVVGVDPRSYRIIWISSYIKVQFQELMKIRHTTAKYSNSMRSSSVGHVTSCPLCH